MGNGKLRALAARQPCVLLSSAKCTVVPWGVQTTQRSVSPRRSASPDHARCQTPWRKARLERIDAAHSRAEMELQAHDRFLVKRGNAELLAQDSFCPPVKFAILQHTVYIIYLHILFWTQYYI